MAKRKTTSEERKKFIEEQRAAEASYKGPGRRLPADMSFIDRERNIVRPSREEYYARKNLSTYNAQHNEAITLNKQYDALVSRYGKGSREVYKFERNKLGMHRKRKSSRLEGVLAIIGLIGGIFFFSNNITGNVIGLNQSTGNILGAGLLIVGLVGSFFWFRSRKK